jgi:hypothetical protein
MRTKALLLMAAGAALGLLHPLAKAQGFDSGSDGSMGALDVRSNTVLALPPDGIFRFTTVTIAGGTTLTFTPNALNTPVYLLATGDVTIDGAIDASGSAGTAVAGGKGGPGGFDGGPPGLAGSSPGDGKGPGGGKGGGQGLDDASAGAGSYLNLPLDVSLNDGVPYGSPLLVPLLGGSGGGGETNGLGGGGGGGAIAIASNTRIALSFNGTLVAKGGSADFNSGSGGAVRLVAPLVEGNGLIDLTANRGAYGRFRVDSIDRTHIQFRLQGSASGQLSVGGFMTVFPPGNPRLDILEAAGTTIPEGTNAPVLINLPFGSDTNRTVTVQARNFNEVVPIEVVLTPDTGPSTVVPANIDNAAVNPATVAVPVGFPVNTPVAVQVWRR